MSNLCKIFEYYIKKQPDKPSWSSRVSASLLFEYQPAIENIPHIQRWLAEVNHRKYANPTEAMIELKRWVCIKQPENLTYFICYADAYIVNPAQAKVSADEKYKFSQSARNQNSGPGPGP